jgi:hypothetical protein
MHSRWPLHDGLACGRDYHPKQWPEVAWAQDVGLMREAGHARLGRALRLGLPRLDRQGLQRVFVRHG